MLDQHEIIKSWQKHYHQHKTQLLNISVPYFYNSLLEESLWEDPREIISILKNNQEHDK